MPINLKDAAINTLEFVSEKAGPPALALSLTPVVLDAGIYSRIAVMKGDFALKHASLCGPLDSLRTASCLNKVTESALSYYSAVEEPPLKTQYHQQTIESLVPLGLVLATIITALKVARDRMHRTILTR